MTSPTLQFTGKERDAETGLDYFGARYLSAAQGRFTSPDAPLVDQRPGDPQSWNLYTYVRNNPLVFIDPNGRECVNGVIENEGDNNGTACFSTEGRADRAIENSYFDAVAQGVNQASTPVRGLAMATGAVVLGAGAGAGALAGPMITLPTISPTVATTGTAVVAASQTPGGRQVVSGLLEAPKIAGLLPQGSGSFMGPINSTVTQAPQTMYRVWGGAGETASQQVGSWLTPTMPTSSIQAINTLSLPANNAATFVSEVVVPAGTRIQSGLAAPLFNLPGGGQQVLLLQRIPTASFGPGRPLN